MRSIVVLLCLVLAGCATPAAPSEEPSAVRSVVLGAVRGVADPAGPVTTPLSSVVLGASQRIDFAVPALPGVSHHVLTFRLDVPADLGDAWLEARATWDGTKHAGVEVSLTGPVASRGTQRGFDAARDQAWGPVAGEYALHLRGEGPMEGWVRLFVKDGLKMPGEDRLPNLVTLAPNQVAVDDCLPEERIEQGAMRCLRLGNAVANLGDGPLEVHLDYPNGVLSTVELGRFVQRVYGDAGFRDIGAGGAQFHPTHGHFHYAGLAEFRLYAYDEATGLRGDEVGRHMKQGFCFLDWGPMDDPETDPEHEENAEQACLIPALLDGWSMGISVGWYDFYWAALADQYVEVSGVPDGVYELVSIADGGQSLAETDETDNSASVIVALRGDQATVLEARSFWANPEG